MSGISKESQYAPSRSNYKSSDKRFAPYSSSRTSRSSNSRSSNKSQGCFKCGKDGHFSRECPQNRGSKNNNRSNDGCFKCGEPGHFSRECPNKRASASSSSLKSNNGNRPSSDFGIKFGQAGAGLVAVDWSNVKLLPFQKNFYTENENTKNNTTKNIESWQKEHDIECYAGYHDQIKGANEGRKSWNKRFDEPPKIKQNKEYKNVPKPIMEFEDAAFPQIIMRAINKAGFERPTAIQSATWPMVLSGNNVIGIARTGSGKTLAFLLPAIVHINAQPKIRYGDGPIAVIIAPTRELACQIEGEVKKFACNIRHCCVYGGAKKWDQKRKLKSGVEIVIATPGRLLDFLESNVTNFRRVTYAVIDEADRLLDMGFEPQLNAIMNQIRPDRQMMMFSATWPKEVRSLAKKYMVGEDGNDHNVFQVAIGSMNKLMANQDVVQKVQFMGKQDKIQNLKKIIDETMSEDKESKILVFISTKKMCNMMQGILWEDGYYVTCIHGDKEQKQRDRALNDFKTGKMKIMLATDVASRGIHVDDIRLVINFDFPTAIEDYVHRIGRTGRAGNKGVAISFFVEEVDGYRAKDLIKVLKDAKQEIPEQLKKYRGSNRGFNSRKGRNYYRNNFGRRW